MSRVEADTVKDLKDDMSLEANSDFEHAQRNVIPGI